MGKFQIEQCGQIEGLYLIQPTVFGDNRGYFMETYNYNEFKELGLWQTLRCLTAHLHQIFTIFIWLAKTLFLKIVEHIRDSVITYISSFITVKPDKITDSVL